MKKLINDPFDFVEEMLDGFCLAHHDLVRRVGRRAIARIDAPIKGKVGIVVGGGSGHLPLYTAFVGNGGADAAAVGNVFASPPARPILEATLAANGGEGVIYVYGNYAGDVLNFDRAAAIAYAEHGIRVETVLVTDDVASAPRAEIHNRRGIAGAFLVCKCAGAKAETKADFDSVLAAIRKANENTRTMGVGLTACTVPANGRPTFNLPDDEMEIGLGVHGEPGIRRTKIMPADRIVDEIVETILADLDFGDSDVAVLVNGLGATPYEELYVIYRRVKQILDAKRIRIRIKFIGEFATSLEMAGASISLMRLDAELYDLLRAPMHTPMIRLSC